MPPLKESREGGGELRNTQIFIRDALHVMFRPFDRSKKVHSLGLDRGIGHFMLFEVDAEVPVPAPPIPKSRQTSSAASDRKTALLPSSRQAELEKSCEGW